MTKTGLNLKTFAVVALAILSAIVGPIPGFAQNDNKVVLATTTSVRDAGLLDVLLPMYSEATGDIVRVVAVGSGHAMELGRRGEADILILHDPSGEEQFLADGFGVDRTSLMHNEFVVVGPSSDPAGVRGASAVEAFSKIAQSGSRFLSRGDNSGTHAKELTIWNRLGGPSRDRSWYWESGQGMSASLQVAYEIRAYILSDIGTYLRHSTGSRLEIMVSGDPALNNPYHVMLVNPARFDGLNVEGARRLRAFLISADVREMISEYGVAEFGRPLFIPDVD